jgi:hypothetical protein
MSNVNTTSGGDLTRTLSGAIQSHPLPAALIGMGLVWLLGGGKSVLSGGGEAYGSGGAKRDFPGATSTGASNSRAFAAAQSNMADLMHRQPLVLGAIGVGVGAVMAAALPSTAMEADLLGQASADVQARMRGVGEDLTERVAGLADDVTAAITKEAQAQGLTADNLKQSTSDAARKVQNFVAQSAQRLGSDASPGTNSVERNGADG